MNKPSKKFIITLVSLCVLIIGGAFVYSLSALNRGPFALNPLTSSAARIGILSPRQQCQIQCDQNHAACLARSSLLGIFTGEVNACDREHVACLNACAYSSSIPVESAN